MTWELFWTIVGIVVVIYMAFAILFYFLTMLFAYASLSKYKRLNEEPLEDEFNMNLFTKPVSILVPSYNEEVGIINTIYSLINVKYPESEIVVIDDGSIDKTSELVIAAFNMVEQSIEPRSALDTKPVKKTYYSQNYSNLTLIVKDNGGKSDALNCGINYSRYPYFCSMDGDSILDENSLLKVMKPIIASDGQVVAAGGNVRIANGSEVDYGKLKESEIYQRPIVAYQIMEYLRAFMLGRIFLTRLNMVLIISGAFSVFKKDIVIKMGGYDTNIIGEDMELVIKMHKWIQTKGTDERIEFVPEPVCWTEAPTALKVLRRQRRRWSQGLIESLWTHKYMTLNPKYKRIGMFAFPYFWFYEAFGGVVELVGYIYLMLSIFWDAVNYPIAVALFISIILYGAIFSIFSLLLEAWSTRSFIRPRMMLYFIFLALVEGLIYRPFTIFFRMEGMIRALFKRQDWGNMERKGIGNEQNEV